MLVKALQTEPYQKVVTAMVGFFGMYADLLTLFFLAPLPLFPSLSLPSLSLSPSYSFSLSFSLSLTLSLFMSLSGFRLSSSSLSIYLSLSICLSVGLPISPLLRSASATSAYLKQAAGWAGSIGSRWSNTGGGGTEKIASTTITKGSEPIKSQYSPPVASGGGGMKLPSTSKSNVGSPIPEGDLLGFAGGEGEGEGWGEGEGGWGDDGGEDLLFPSKSSSEIVSGGVGMSLKPNTNTSGGGSGGGLNTNDFFSDMMAGGTSAGGGGKKGSKKIKAKKLSISDDDDWDNW